MDMNLIAVLSIAAVVIAISISCFVIWKTQKQIALISEALADIKAGNGNRRILAGEHELTASLAFEINEVVISYENKLALLRRADEANKQLMTSLSHDVRTPLTTLIGYLDAVHKGIVTGADRNSYIESARRKAYDLKEYVDILFDWFKLNSNEFAMDVHPVEAVALTRSILIDWIPILEEQHINYTFDIPEQPFQVDLDSDGYMRIINNLMQNAVTHSRADKISLALSEQQGSMRILLADNGIGMENTDLEHIFDRLYKCDKGRTSKGNGLGLSIVQQLVEKLNGTITAESEPGKGTSFILQFPLTS